MPVGITCSATSTSGIRGHGPQHATTGDTSTRRSLCSGGSYYRRESKPVTRLRQRVFCLWR
uniref:Uncharacterized protein n=1 Tax=Zea mays TaxID=4577 RepID=B6T1N9_MAIZE|nr:hypothetical protein [Zea mays]